MFVTSNDVSLNKRKIRQHRQRRQRRQWRRPTFKWITYSYANRSNQMDEDKRQTMEV